jgi:uncharacterized protein YdeI (YjbR/CyaY-like superfamily)
MLPSNITFFKTPAEFRKWLAKNHATAAELWVGFYKRDSGKPSITWPESVDEALCVGWIDGIRKNLDETSYTIRFTRRKTGSIWSAVNIKRAGELIELRRMKAAGLEAFEKRTEDRSRRYSYEQQGSQLAGEYEEKLKANSRAWQFFKAQAPGYQRVIGWWVMSAKKEETRLRRLEQLIARCECHEKIDSMSPTKKVVRPGGIEGSS